ncbi:unnamed protein product [Ambrosiozyma monospora]|uniref:Unnamed protein product n=1 Tax=Ambrosiozyma monospora TaxID=43982 RepID=A0A9W6T731_AMBMO|nr:unnamed protein product [Ambrosiozyma monospora]
MMCFLWKVMSDLKHDANLRNCFIVLDNVATHKGIEISHLVKYANRKFGTGFKLCYNPPYSPQLNPIEKYWNSLKVEFGKTKTPFKIKEESASVTWRVNKASQKLGNKNLCNYVRNAYHNTKLCEAGEPLPVG